MIARKNNEDNETTDLPAEKSTGLQEDPREGSGEIPIDALTEEIQRAPFDEARKVVRTAILQQTFSGPLPHPKTLNGYTPDHADIIVGMAKSEQAHNHKLEQKSIEAGIATEKRGQNYALIVSLSVIVGAIYLIASGKQLSGVFLAGSTLIGLAYVFITGRKKEPEGSRHHTD